MFNCRKFDIFSFVEIIMYRRELNVHRSNIVILLRLIRPILCSVFFFEVFRVARLIFCFVAMKLQDAIYNLPWNATFFWNFIIPKE